MNVRPLALALLVVASGSGIALVAQRTPGSAREQAWRANNLGVAYLEQFSYETAATHFRRALELDEALTAARVNLAIAQFYVPDLEAAQREAGAAASRPDSPPHADFLLGLVARAENHEEDAVAAFRRVLDADPDDVGTLVNLGQLLLQRREYEEAVTVFARAVDLEPYNVSALYNLAVANTRAGNREAGAEVTARFQTLRESGYGTTYSNTYLEQGRYAEAILSTGAEPDLVSREQPPLRYVGTPLPSTGGAPADGIVALAAGDIDRNGRTDVVAVRPESLTLVRHADLRPAASPASSSPEAAASETIAVTGLGARGVAVADMDNDGTPDLVAHGRGGVRLLRQGDAGRFADVTEAAGLSSSLDVLALALVDLDHDGDLDIVAGGQTRQGAPARMEAWRNNGDGTFTDITAETFGTQTPATIRLIAATDFDLRRDIDLIVLAEGGSPRLWRNMRDRTFRDASRETGLDALPPATTFAIGDVDKDGYPDLFVSTVSGAPLMAFGSSSNRFRIEPAEALPGAASSAVFLDADRDGLLDLVAANAEGLHLLRGVGDGWQPLTGTAFPADTGTTAAGAALVALAASDDTSLDLITVAAGRVQIWRPEALQHPGMRVRLTGQVSNRTGVGSKVELRAGSLWQKTETAVSSPAVAPADVVFGLGTRDLVDVVRVLWPAGIVQAETMEGEDASTRRHVEVVELDRKPSSCPYLYTWNGERFEFVTDFLGGGEMGYQLAPGVFNTPDPEEFVRIRGDQLVARDGRYELRVTNELEETLFLDMFRLITVDHPAAVEVHPREGLFAPPFPSFELFAARDLRAPAAAVDHAGRDVLDRLAAVDRRFVDRLPTLPIRGYAEPHALTLDLGPDTPADGALLLLTGWTDYAFSSDNIAASQAGYAMLPPSLQVRDEAGAWQTVIDEVGVPVGRPQTVVVDLSGAFRSASREVRIVTSMRIYWDRIQVGTRDTATAPVLTRLDPIEATLRWRGFSAEATREEPFTFDYARVSPSSPWKQMPGRYTREGDVLELLTEVDDRFVVSRPGDEVALGFDATALPALRPGWTRTFLLHGDGFSKEMDLNSSSPDQAWPLPSHGMTAYPAPIYPAPTYPAQSLDDEKLVLPEPEWVTRYNTRVVGRQVPRLAGVAP